MKKEKTLQEKIELINEFKETFSRSSYDINVRHLLKSLSVDEILQPDFEDKLVPAVISYGGLKGALGFIDAMQQSYMTEYMTNITDEDKDKIYQKLFDSLKKANGSVTGYSLSVSEKYRGKFLIKIIDNGMLSRFYSSSNMVFIKDLADHVMSFGSPEDISRVFDTFGKDAIFKDYYVGYPLVIINVSLPKEDKISIIKKTYIQKDLNKYTVFIRENLTDFDDLDDFIEATITQNKRVKEKTRGIVDLIKRLFFGLRGESYYNILENLSNIKHKDEFMTKYRDYLDADLIKQIKDSFTWSQQQNVIKFFKYMYSGQPYRYKMKIAAVSSELAQGLFDISRPLPPKEIVGIEEDERTFYKLITTNYSLQKIIENFPVEVAVYVNKYPELFTKKFSDEMAFDTIVNGYYYGSNSENRLNTAVNFLSKIDEKNIHMFNIFSDENYFSSFGLLSAGAYNVESDAASRGKTFITKTLPALEILIKKSDFVKKFVFNKYLSKLEDEDYVNDSVTRLSVTLNTGRTMNYFMKEVGVSSPIDAIEKFSILSDIVEKNYQGYKIDEILKNIKKIKTEVGIICSL